MCEETPGGEVGPWNVAAEAIREAVHTRGVPRWWLIVCLVLGLAGLIGLAVVGGPAPAYYSVVLVVGIGVLAGPKKKSCGCG